MQDSLSDFTAVKTASTNNSGAASISVVNTNDNGKRVKISKKALQILGNPDKVQFGLSNTSIIIAAELPDNDNYFKVSKGNVYSSNLVAEITGHFKLDYSNGRTSLSFSDEQTLDLDSGKTALVFKIM